MNNHLIENLSNQAIENVSNKRKLSDGQIERTWLQYDFDQEFARLLIEEALRTATLFEYSDSLDDYIIGLEDAQKQIVTAIKIKFGVK